MQKQLLLKSSNDLIQRPATRLRVNSPRHEVNVREWYIGQLKAPWRLYCAALANHLKVYKKIKLVYIHESRPHSSIIVIVTGFSQS